MYRSRFCWSIWCSIQTSSELTRPWLSLNPTTCMFQVCCRPQLSEICGHVQRRQAGGTALIFVEDIVGTFGPSGK
jgi:hypothetical protein